ncbi:hypothetical protein K5I29_12075 [Flavobacterium agricola]|uniref:Uncharacterized protein n=1 Tax=Flavobacterium agricola TaxID=2870839 RepID=A0ABY6M193_9FLAO|nr:hypothetical protein [Flavobacterium agricola]UYW01180.1 hypothetical protein K5I29_12075 [Flavobacterium agricola]
MKQLVIILQTQVPNIEEKIKDAPNNDYTIGVLIGSFLPLVFLCILAYGIYYYNKNKKTD